MDWAKRRPTDNKPEIKAVEVDDLKPQHNHFCQMTVTYQNGDQQTLFSRVLYNEKTGNWSLDGMHVVLDIIEF